MDEDGDAVENAVEGEPEYLIKKSFLYFREDTKRFSIKPNQ